MSQRSTPDHLNRRNFPALMAGSGRRLRLLVNSCRMTDEELIKFGKDVRRLAENPFQRQLEEARREWKQRKGLGKWQ